MASSIVEKFYSMEYGPAPEDAGEVTKWLEAHGRSFGHYIDGGWTKTWGCKATARRRSLRVEGWRAVVVAIVVAIVSTASRGLPSTRN